MSGTVQMLRGVFGSAVGNVWAVGTQGTILHWDGSAWSQKLSGTDNSLGAVWGSDVTNFWIAGDSGTLLQRQQ